MNHQDPLYSPIALLYKAGRQDIPAEAAKISKAGTELYEAMTTLNHEAARAGDPPVLMSMLEIGGAVCEAMRRGVQALDNGAEAVIRSADLVRVTDARAREDFDELQKKTGADYTPLGRGHLTRHALPPAVPGRGEPGSFEERGAPAAPGGPVSTPGGLPRTRFDRDDLETPTSQPTRTTPTPVDPLDDRAQREARERRDRADNPTHLPSHDTPAPHSPRTGTATTRSPQ